MLEKSVQKTETTSPIFWKSLGSMFWKSLDKIDFANEWIGKTAAWLLVPMLFVQVYEVIARYVFNHPTLWAWDIGMQLLSVISFLCAGYVLLHGGHVAVDIIPRAVSPRKRIILELISSVVVLVALVLTLWQFIGFITISISVREVSSSAFRAPMAPVKTIAGVGLSLLILQVIAGLVRNVAKLSGKAEADHTASDGGADKPVISM